MGTNSVVRFCERRHFSVKNFFRLAIILSLPFIMAGKAASQYGGGTSGGGSGSGNGPYVPPKGGYSSATGAALALARPLVPLTYFSLFTTVAVLSVASNPEKTVCVCWMKARTSLMP
jgi:hypothetical protein